jgi:hypothetical protein
VGSPARKTILGASPALRAASAVYVTLTREPKAVRATYPTLEVIDARPGSELAEPRPLLEAIRDRCLGPRRQLLLLDSLEAMSALWRAEVAGRFFTRGCPLLLGLGAIAHWSLTPARHSPALRREIDGITQCVLVLGEGRLRIAKAEGAHRAWSEASFATGSRTAGPSSLRPRRLLAWARHSAPSACSAG